jgi:hypothetical protein
MKCKNCDQEMGKGPRCPTCNRITEGLDQLSGSPTLIKGIARPITPGTNSRPEPRCGALLPLLWMGAILIAIPWMLAIRESAAAPYAVTAGEVSSLSPLSSQAPAVSPSPSSEDAAVSDDDQISLVIHLPVNHWVDTGIDMCGCAHVKVTATGHWLTPEGQSASADGVALDSTDSLTRNDSLARKIRYGALVGKVGTDPYVLVGSSHAVNGDDFNDGGTLELGMNAGRHRSLSDGDGEVTVTVTGTGIVDHQPSFAPAPL